VWGIGHGAWGPGETPVYDREPFGLFHGAGMGHGEEGIGHGAWSVEQGERGGNIRNKEGIGYNHPRPLLG